MVSTCKGTVDICTTAIETGFILYIRETPKWLVLAKVQWEFIQRQQRRGLLFIYE